MASGTKNVDSFFNLREAFDTIDRKILFAKLDNYGVRGIVLDWFKSYLNLRMQRVEIMGVSSNWIQVKMAFHKVLF